AIEPSLLWLCRGKMGEQRFHNVRLLLEVKLCMAEEDCQRRGIFVGSVWAKPSNSQMDQPTSDELPSLLRIDGPRPQKVEIFQSRVNRPTVFCQLNWYKTMRTDA